MLAYSALSRLTGDVRQVRQVVEAVAGAGDRDPPRRTGVRQPVREAAQLQPRVVGEQVRLAGDLGGGRVDLDRPVDLVEPQGRELEERAVGAAADAVADGGHGGLGQLQDLARAEGHREPGCDAGVDDHVLTARAAHAGAPAPRMRLVGVGVGDQLLCRILALHEVAERLAGEDEPRLRADQVGRALTQAARDRRGTLVMAARAAVARERRGGVDIEHVGVDRGLARAAGQVVHAVLRRPVPVELALDAIGERPVLRVAPPEVAPAASAASADGGAAMSSSHGSASAAPPRWRNVRRLSALIPSPGG